MNYESERMKISGEMAAMESGTRQLAVPSVTVQGNATPTYNKNEALAQGTLFPELNLPFRLMVNGAPVPASQLSALQALSFVITELGLYLDTHPKDMEAFRMFQEYVKLEKEARERYEKDHGPLQQKSAAKDSSYTWLKDPWPWNKREAD